MTAQPVVHIVVAYNGVDSDNMAVIVGDETAARRKALELHKDDSPTAVETWTTTEKVTEWALPVRPCEPGIGDYADAREIYEQELKTYEANMAKIKAELGV